MYIQLVCYQCTSKTSMNCQLPVNNKLLKDSVPILSSALPSKSRPVSYPLIRVLACFCPGDVCRLFSIACWWCHSAKISRSANHWADGVKDETYEFRPIPFCTKNKKLLLY